MRFVRNRMGVSVLQHFSTHTQEDVHRRRQCDNAAIRQYGMGGLKNTKEQATSQALWEEDSWQVFGAPETRDRRPEREQWETR